MKFVVVGLSHRTAPLDVREKAFIPESAAQACVQRLMDRDLIEGGLLLSTCNRTELYAISAAHDQGEAVFASFASWPHELPFDDWKQYGYRLADEEALGHVFRVAGGLDSMVVGEGQVLGQLRRALERAQLAGTTDASLQIVLRGAIRAGKRVRQETALGRRAVSVSHAAVAQARVVLGTLADREVLLVGAGEMSEVALRLLKKQGITRVHLASRTLERAERVAVQGGGNPLAMAAIDDMVERVDIIICASGAPHHLFGAGDIRRFQDRRLKRPVVIIDLAVPRDVDPEAAALPGVHLFNIDDLRAIAERNLEERRTFVSAAEAIIDEEVRRTRLRLESREVAPLIEALARRMERTRDQELERQLRALPADDVRGRAALRALAHGLTAKFLHGAARHLQGSPDPRVDAAVLDALFGGEDAPDG